MARSCSVLHGPERHPLPTRLATRLAPTPPPPPDSPPGFELDATRNDTTEDTHTRNWMREPTSLAAAVTPQDRHATLPSTALPYRHQAQIRHLQASVAEEERGAIALQLARLGRVARTPRRRRVPLPP